jgi:hypothetical protein
LAATGWLGLCVAAAVRIQSVFRRFAAKRQAAAAAVSLVAAAAVCAAAPIQLLTAAAPAAPQPALLGGPVTPALTAAVVCTAPPAVAALGQAPLVAAAAVAAPAVAALGQALLAAAGTPAAGRGVPTARPKSVRCSRGAAPPAVAAPVPAGVAVVVRAGGRGASGRGAEASVNRANATGAPPGGTHVAAPVFTAAASPLLPPSVAGTLFRRINPDEPVDAAADKRRAAAAVASLGNRTVDDVDWGELQGLLNACGLLHRWRLPNKQDAGKEDMAAALRAFLELAGVAAPGEATNAAARKTVAQALQLALGSGKSNQALRRQHLAAMGSVDADFKGHAKATEDQKKKLIDQFIVMYA